MRQGAPRIKLSPGRQKEVFFIRGGDGGAKIPPETFSSTTVLFFFEKERTEMTFSPLGISFFFSSPLTCRYVVSFN